MLGGGGIGEHEASAVTGGGGIEEQVTAVSGGGGTDEQDASAVAGGGGIGEHEASAVSGGGGIAEHEASAVTGPAGSASTRPARSPAAAVSRNSPAPYSAAAGYLIPDGPGGEPGPTRLGSHRTPYPYSAADGPSSHFPGGQKPPSPHTGPFPPRAPAPPASRRCSALAARHSRFRCVLRPCRAARRSSSPAASPGISRGPRARSSPASSADRAVSAMAGARQARKHPAICRVTSSRPPKPASLPPAWLHLTVTAWRPHGTRDPGGPRARLTHGSPVSSRADSAICAPVVCGGGRSSGVAGGFSARRDSNPNLHAPWRV